MPSLRAGCHLEQILRLDPVQDCEQIVYLNACYEFPFDNARALELALFRTFAIPSIAKLLDATQEFGQRAQKRYDDTDLLISEFIESGFSSQRGQRAIRRMNQIHGRFNINQDDYCYVLSTFVVEPCRWNARFGWRPFSEHEKIALFEFWRQVGKLMNIRDIPESYEALDQFNLDYERTRFSYTPENARVAHATKTLLLKWRVPKPLWPAASVAIDAMLDEPLRQAVGLDPAPQWLHTLLTQIMAARAQTLKHAPERRFPVHRTKHKHPSYPDGYQVEQLGPQPPPPGFPAELLKRRPSPTNEQP